MFCELCMNMLPPVNVKAFNSMQSEIAAAYVNISKLSMTERFASEKYPGEPEDSKANVAGNIRKI